MLELLKADARRIPLADECVQCVVTSPPYWGLRKYAGEQELVWGGRDCEHEWISERYYTEQTAAIASGEAFSQPGDNNKARLKAGRWRETNTCAKCGAWRGAYGLEPSADCRQPFMKLRDDLTDAQREYVAQRLRDAGISL